MKAYIHAIGRHNSLQEHTTSDLTLELKELSGKVYRRTDHFIQLAILGAHKACSGRQLDKQTGLIITSGQGNIEVFQKICHQRHINKMLPRPVDFINLLSNAAGFYVAAHLSLQGTNHFVSHHHFPVQMALLSALSTIEQQQDMAMLVGGVDAWHPDRQLHQKLLGRNLQSIPGEGSNWMLLTKQPGDSRGEIRLTLPYLDATGLNHLLNKQASGVFLSFSKKISEKHRAEIINSHAQCLHYWYEETCGTYETLPMYVLNSFLATEQGTMIHIDKHDEQYMVMSVKTR